MNLGETQLSVNDYLDLYLYAKSMEDPLWQQEIIEKLQTYQDEIRKGIESIALKHQMEKYKHN